MKLVSKADHLSLSGMFCAWECTDIIVLCQELIHSLRHSKSRKGGIIIKFDLDKAYDRMERKYIEETLNDAAIPLMTASVTMRLITSGSCRLLWNREFTNSIRPSRGLRLGDLLSSYDFVLCME